MFNVGGGELLVIMLVALIVLGPQRLPGAARQVGKTLGDLRRLSTGFQNEVRSAISDADNPDRVAARRNVLAKEATVDAEADGAVTSEPPPAARRPSAQERAAAKNGAPVRTARKAPLRAAPTGKQPTAKKAAGTKQGAAKKPGPKKAAAKSPARRSRS